MGYYTETHNDAVNGDFVNRENEPIKAIMYSQKVWDEMSHSQKLAVRIIIFTTVFLVIGSL